MSLFFKIRRYRFGKKWRKKNSHNETYPINIFDPALVIIGKKTYGKLYVSMYNSTSKLYIGNYCSIGPHVAFLLSSDHATTHLSTYPFKVKLGCSDFEGISKGDIVIDDDVWIGYGSIILSGIHIGQGAVIAAGSVVTKDIPPYSIVGGNPARIIKYRFKDDVINDLLKINYSLFDENKAKHQIDNLYYDINSPEDVERLKCKYFVIDGENRNDFKN